MKAIDLNAFRRRLTAMIGRLHNERLQLRHEVLGDERDPAVCTTQEQFTNDDLSREFADEEVSQSLLGNEEMLLAECQAALERIDRGTFGRCEDCSKPISRRRLDAVPYVRRCIRCARVAEAA